MNKGNDYLNTLLNKYTEIPRVFFSLSLRLTIDKKIYSTGFEHSSICQFTYEWISDVQNRRDFCIVYRSPQFKIQ